MPRPPSDISVRILHAARERFLVEGVDGASLRQIAKDADTNIGMVYYYFETKDELFLSVIDEVYQKLLEDLVVVLAPERSVQERIDGLFVRFARISTEEFTVMRIMIREALISSARLKRAAERFISGHIPMLFSTLLQGVNERLFTKQHHPALLLMVTALLSIFPQLMRRQIDPFVPEWLGLPKGEELAKIMKDLLLHGIARRSQEPVGS